MKRLVPDELIEGEETVSNDKIFNDIMESLTTATVRLHDGNAQKLLSEAIPWVGRAPVTDEERAHVSRLREQATTLLTR